MRLASTLLTFIAGVSLTSCELVIGRERGDITAPDMSAPDMSAPDMSAPDMSPFVEPDPPSGWVRCAGFTNTSGDDAAANFLDGCLNGNRLRIRVWNTTNNMLEEDLYLTSTTTWTSWKEGYLDPFGTFTAAKVTNWYATLSFYITTSGRSTCGTEIGSGASLIFTSNLCGRPVVAGGAMGADEYRFGNDGGMNLPDRAIAFYH